VKNIVVSKGVFASCVENVNYSLQTEKTDAGGA